MTNWIWYEPAVGWSAFDRNDAFTKRCMPSFRKATGITSGSIATLSRLASCESLRDAAIWSPISNINQFVDERFVYLATRAAPPPQLLIRLQWSSASFASVRFEPYDAGGRCTARLAPTRPSPDSAARWEPMDANISTHISMRTRRFSRSIQ